MTGVLSVPQPLGVEGALRLKVMVCVLLSPHDVKVRVAVVVQSAAANVPVGPVMVMDEAWQVLLSSNVLIVTPVSDGRVTVDRSTAPGHTSLTVSALGVLSVVLLEMMTVLSRVLRSHAKSTRWKARVRPTRAP